MVQTAHKNNLSSAFTIVELLIVIVVIAILAAITIVAYNGIQDRARASAASSSSSQAAKKVKVWQVDNEATSPTCAQFYTLVTGSSSGAPTGTCSFDYKDTNYQYTPNSTPTVAGSFCVTTTVVNKSYKASDSSTPQSGGCSGHGQGGVGAVTNLVSNPAIASNGTGWGSVASTNGAYTSARTTAVSGLSSLGITTSWRISLTAAPDTWWRNQFGTINVTAGQPYTYSAYIRPSVTTQTGVIIIWRNSSNVTMAESPSTFSSQTAGTWERKSITATAPAGAVTAILHSGASTGGTAGAYLDTTAVMFTSGSALYNYADGNSTDWTWSGTLNNSTSTGPVL